MNRLECTTCNSEFQYDPLWTYCPHCGNNLRVVNRPDIIAELKMRVELLEDIIDNLRLNENETKIDTESDDSPWD